MSSDYTKYINGIPTVEQAVLAGLKDTVHGLYEFDEQFLRTQSEALLEEVRCIFTAELSTLFDRDGVAQDWNEAIELAIKVVEGSAP